MLEVLTAIRRAGADLILTYHAKRRGRVAAREPSPEADGRHDRRRSEELFERARRVIPGGVNSPVRAFGAVGGAPLFVAPGHGAWIRTSTAARYVDLVQSWGALLFGHARPEVVDAGPTRPRRAARRSARRPRARWSWPSGSSRWCPASRCSGWSPPGPRPP